MTCVKARTRSALAVDKTMAKGRQHGDVDRYRYRGCETAATWLMINRSLGHPWDCMVTKGWYKCIKLSKGARLARHSSLRSEDERALYLLLDGCICCCMATFLIYVMRDHDIQPGWSWCALAIDIGGSSSRNSTMPVADEVQNLLRTHRITTTRFIGGSSCCSSSKQATTNSSSNSSTEF
jgi:hypothetical protein